MLAAARLERPSQPTASAAGGGQPEVEYPQSDGKPMADNTLQYEWIVTIKGGLDALVPDFVAGDLLWYPVEGDPRTVQAPDVLVALGRPKGHRPSYKQWEEAGVAPQVVFEVLSPSNTLAEMHRKMLFYQRFGVEEYYVLDPDRRAWMGYRRTGSDLAEIPEMDGFVSPRLGIRFGHEGEEPAIYGPDGARLQSFAEVRASEAEQRARAEAEKARAEAEKARAEAEKARADALAERLRALGVEV